MTPSAVVRQSHPAKRDIREILAYLNEQSPAAADRFNRVFKEKTSALAQMPEMGRSREDLAIGIRSFTASKYIILYRPIAGGIVVVRVIHGSRDIPHLFDS